MLARRPVYALSGLLRCGVCGGGMSVVGKRRLGCSTRANKGPQLCGNGATVSYKDIEQQVLDAIDQDLMQADRVQAFVRGYNGRLEDAVAQAEADRRDVTAELRRVGREVDNVVTAIARVGVSDALGDQLRRLEREQAELRRRLDALRPPQRLSVGAGDLARYREQMDAFITLARDPARAIEANELVRGIVERVVLHPPGTDGNDGWSIELDGRLPALWGWLQNVPRLEDVDYTKFATILEDDITAAGEAALRAGEVPDPVKLVAGAGFEPATFRL